MEGEWREVDWGDLAILEYGKGIRGYEDAGGPYRVFGTNGPIGWHKEFLSEQPTVIVGRKGAYRGIHYSADPCFVIDTAFYLKKLIAFDIRWAYYELLTHDINGMDSGSAIPSTSRQAFYRLHVKLPPLPEQRAIAHILGTLDDKIELNRRMNETLEQMARALFKSWFVDFDPVRAKAAVRRQHPNWTNEQVSRLSAEQAGAAMARARGRVPLQPEITALFPDSFEDSELGEIPKGWRVKSFANDIDVIGGGTPKTSNPDYWGGNIPWFSVADTPATGEVFVISTEKTITQEGLNNSSTRILPFGTTIISARGTVGNLALVGVPMAMNQSCYGLRDRRTSRGYFLYFATAAVVDILRQMTHGSVFNTITRDTLNSIHVAASPDSLVNAFERVTEGLLLRILSALQESRTLAALRDTLLPKLISGELRVPDAERIAGRCV